MRMMNEGYEMRQIFGKSCKALRTSLLSVEEPDDYYCFYFYLGSNVIKIKPFLWVSKLI